jgi:polar amino acid transport system permease protein
MNWNLSAVLNNLPFLLAGLKMTVMVSLVSMALGAVVGLLVALVRMSGVRSLEFLAGLYIDIWRSTPLLIQLIWVFYALPILTGVLLSPLPAAFLTMGLNVSAYLAEIYRAGILSIPRSQGDAGRSLGMTWDQVLRRVILPQAITRVLPPIGSQFVSLVKDSALVSLINLPELMWRMQSLAATTLHPLEVLSAGALIYMIATLPLAVVVNALHRRYLAH